MIEEKETNAPVSLDEILAEKKPVIDKPSLHVGFPIGVGDTGMSMGRMGRQRTYDRDDVDDDVPSGETVGARISNTRGKPR